MYIKNSKGPRIDPCGTPILIALEDDVVELWDTNGYLEERNFQLICEPVHEYRSDITFVKEFYGKQYQMPYGDLET